MNLKKMNLKKTGMEATFWGINRFKCKSGANTDSSFGGDFEQN
jgi:hypothetical protein